MFLAWCLWQCLTQVVQPYCKVRWILSAVQCHAVCVVLMQTLGTCMSVATAAKAGQEVPDSYFLATDPRLLQIMLDLRMSWAVNMVPMVKDERLGMGPGLHKLVIRGLVKAANIKDTVGGLQFVCAAQTCCNT